MLVQPPPLPVILSVTEPATRSTGEGAYTVPRFTDDENEPPPLVDHINVVNPVAVA